MSTSPQDDILRIVAGLWQSRALAVAAELQLADHLANGPMPIAALASKTETHTESLFRMMRALESAGVFTQVSPRVFANTATSDCLRKDVPGSQWAFVRLVLSTDMQEYNAWGGLMHSIRTGGIAFDEMHGYPYWKLLVDNPDKYSICNEAMRSVSAVATPAVTASYDWSRFAVIADIGGGIGSQLANILDAFPSCRGVLFDLPQAVASAIRHERMECVAGDVFIKVPSGADAYILRWVIHDWEESKAVAILENVRRAMKPGAQLILVENLIPESPEPAFGKWMDLLMMIVAGGRERTASEYGELYAKAGLTLERIIPTPSMVSLIVGKPSVIEPRSGGRT